MGAPFLSFGQGRFPTPLFRWGFNFCPIVPFLDGLPFVTFPFPPTGGVNPPRFLGIYPLLLGALRPSLFGDLTPSWGFNPGARGRFYPLLFGGNFYRPRAFVKFARFAVLSGFPYFCRCFRRAFPLIRGFPRFILWGLPLAPFFGGLFYPPRLVLALTFFPLWGCTPRGFSHGAPSSFRALFGGAPPLLGLHFWRPSPCWAPASRTS